MFITIPIHDIVPKQSYTMYLKPLINCIKPNMQTGPWIAGGVFQRLYHNMRINDIDVWFKTEEDFQRSLVAVRDNNDAVESYRTGNAISFHISPIDTSKNPPKPNGSPIVWQLINKQFYNTPEDVIANFDLAPCMFLTDGAVIMTTEAALDSIKSKTIACADINGRTTVSAHRVSKYLKLGYKPTFPIIAHVLNQPHGTWEGTNDS